MLSTHALPIEFRCQARITVEWCNLKDDASCPIHHEYITFMRGIDVADQLRTSYTGWTHSHKWWHHPFWFLLDQMAMNMYLYYVGILQQGQIRRAPMMHSQFKTNFCEALLSNWQGMKEDPPVELLVRPRIHLST